MSREVRRVPLDFNWPIEKVWSGYLRPDEFDEEKCKACDGSGYSSYARWLRDRWYGYIPFDPAESGSTRLTPDTPGVRAFAERNVAHSPEFYGRGEWAIHREGERLAQLWNGMWSHHLRQQDVDALIKGGRLKDFTHRWVQGDGWQPLDPVPVVTAEQVNAWSLANMGHDSINSWVVVRAACEQAGWPETCGECKGHGSHERYEGQRAAAEAWEPTDPPTGEGWQLWETTSEGSPKSPVFETGEGLAQWMSQNPCGFGGAVISLETARKWVKGAGWSPSMILSPDRGLQDGITAVADMDDAS